MSVKDNWLMTRPISELKAEFPNSLKCSSPSTSQSNTTANFSCSNLTDTITSRPPLTWNFLPCTNKSSQPKEKKSDSKQTDWERVSKNFNRPTKKSKKWRFNSEKCSLNLKRKIKKYQSFLSVSREIKQTPSNNKPLLLMNKKKPL